MLRSLLLIAFVASVGASCSEPPPDNETRILGDYMSAAHRVTLPDTLEWWLVVTGNACATCNTSVLKRALEIADDNPRLRIVTTERLCGMLSVRLSPARADAVLCDSTGALRRLDLPTSGVTLVKVSERRVISRQEVDETNVDRLVTMMGNTTQDLRGVRP